MLNFLKEKNNKNLDLPQTSLQHRELVLRKKFLKKLYTRWYENFITEIRDNKKGKIVEIGSGGGFLKDLYQEVITSDIIELPHCDLTFAADKMPFETGEVSAIFMLDVLHHIANVDEFFIEANRCLHEKGIIYMIEPANTFFSRFIYKNFHHEPFNPQAKEWHFPSSGPLSDANGALPWIIFERDRNIFEQKYPEFKIEFIKKHTPFRYLITGGLSYKSLVPGFSFSFLSFMEQLLNPLYNKIAMFQTIKISKK